MIDRAPIVALLHKWTHFAERWWYDLPEHPGYGCFGTGYNTWGVQTNQKYVAAQAMMAVEASLSTADRDWALQRCLAAMRFSTDSHRSGTLRCTDGTQWGHTWISCLGIERMMHGLHAIRELLNDEDQQRIRRMITSECDWLITSYRRGAHEGVQAGKWHTSGANDPESNLWNGCMLWRGASEYGDHPHADQWRDMALKFMANGVSIDCDAHDTTIFDGKPLKDRHVGSSFFDSYALDHHGYLNVGYMVICLSQAAILHFDYKLAGLPTPQLLHLHQKDLWKTVRGMIFDDGRLARIGGDSRIRYAYCQEYLVPSLMYAADQFGEPDCKRLLNGIFNQYDIQAKSNTDGSFYGKRLEPVMRVNPYYYIRIEGDRASALSMALAYDSCVEEKKGAPEFPKVWSWSDTEHGAAVHRSPTRFASFSWRAFRIGQGLCLPPEKSDLAEWEQNLTGEVDFAHQVHPYWETSPVARRKILQHHFDFFEGGFLTSGVMAEGVATSLSEGWNASDLAKHYLAFVALPDDRTVVGIQVVRAAPMRVLVKSVKGMRLNIPNDVYNHYIRHIQAEDIDKKLHEVHRDYVMDLHSRWVTIDERLSACALAGCTTLTVDRQLQHRGGSIPNLHVEQICAGQRAQSPWFVKPNSLIMDCAWMVSTVGASVAKKLSERNAGGYLPQDNPQVRAVRVVDVNNRTHIIALNISDQDQHTTIEGKPIHLRATQAVMI